MHLWALSYRYVIRKELHICTIILHIYIGCSLFCMHLHLPKLCKTYEGIDPPYMCILTLRFLTLRLTVFSPNTKLMASIKLDFPGVKTTHTTIQSGRYVIKMSLFSDRSDVTIWVMPTVIFLYSYYCIVLYLLCCLIFFLATSIIPCMHIVHFNQGCVCTKKLGSLGLTALVWADFSNMHLKTCIEKAPERMLLRKKWTCSCSP